MAQKSKKNQLDLNNNLERYTSIRLGDVITIDLNNKTISFTNIFGKKETVGLDKEISYYNNRTNRIEQGIIFIQKHERYSPFLKIAFLGSQGQLGFNTKHEFVQQLKNIARISIYDTSYLGNEIYDSSVEYTNRINQQKWFEKLADTLLEKGLGVIDTVGQSCSSVDNVFKLRRQNIPIMFYEIEEDVKLPYRPSCTTGINNDYCYYYIESQLFKKPRRLLEETKVKIQTNQLIALMSTKQHPDCCGIKVAYAHNFSNIDNLTEKLNIEDFQTQFLRLRALRVGRAPWIAHITEDQYYTTKKVYDALGQNNFKLIHCYENPNSENTIEVIHIEFPYEDSREDQLPMYNAFHNLKLFLYFWFKTLKNNASGKNMYNVPSLCKIGKNN